ncbi:permease [Cenarchaeum symbiosum A]|uniref:Permease n=1 Tax=Cenarchaeum symbiosum (strain A) TaxID=414004 RepID=A0RW47_CENSY|nr:permease [Cenarchaeum symbiosum A]
MRAGVLQQASLNNYVRIATFFQNAGISVVAIFMPLIVKGATPSVLEVGLVLSSFAVAQIISEIYFGRISDRRGARLLFIRAGFVLCAVTFGLHYFADSVPLLLAARIAAGVASGIMIPAMMAYAYESGKEKRKVASVVSFHALGWLAGIAAAGLANDTSIIFLISAGVFIAGLAVTSKLPDIHVPKDTARGTTMRIISQSRFLFLSLLLRHVGAVSVWTVLPLMIVEDFGGEIYHVSAVYMGNTATAFVIMTLMATRIRMHNVTKFKAGVGVTIFVFVGMLFVTEWWHFFPLMVLVGGTWAFLYIGGNFHLMEHHPKSTSTGIFSSTLSISMVAGPVAAGAIADSYGYGAVLYFAIAISLAAFATSTRIPLRPASRGPSAA